MIELDSQNGSTMTHPTDCPWIKVKDFIETSLWASVENITTRTHLERTQGAQLSELESRGLTLQLPNRICAVGHHLIVRFRKQERNPLEPSVSPKVLGEFQATAKVVELEPLNSEEMTVVLKLYQYHEREWIAFVQDYAKRGDEAQRLLRRMQD